MLFFSLANFYFTKVIRCLFAKIYSFDIDSRAKMLYYTVRTTFHIIKEK